MGRPGACARPYDYTQMIEARLGCSRSRAQLAPLFVELQFGSERASRRCARVTVRAPRARSAALPAAGCAWVWGSRRASCLGIGERCGAAGMRAGGVRRRGLFHTHSPILLRIHVAHLTSLEPRRHPADPGAVTAGTPAVGRRARPPRSPRRRRAGTARAEAAPRTRRRPARGAKRQRQRTERIERAGVSDMLSPPACRQCSGPRET